MRLFEQPYRDGLWRMEIADHQGRRFVNCRKWYLDGKEWKPTRQGFTFPISRLPELAENIGAFLDDDKDSADS